MLRSTFSLFIYSFLNNYVWNILLKFKNVYEKIQKIKASNHPCGSSEVTLKFQKLYKILQFLKFIKRLQQNLMFATNVNMQM